MALPTLTHDDVVNIEEFAAIVCKKKRYGKIPPTLVVGGTIVPIRAVKPRNGAPTTLGAQELRALYSPRNKDIQICCGGVEIAENTEAFDHIVCVVGHEALHVIQYPHFSEDQIEKAIALNGKAKESPDAYASYITCDVELPAHAVMIALELRQTDLTYFEEAARETSKYRYFAERLDGSSMTDEALRQLIATAQGMHAELRPTLGR